jgi:hypothetical protein
VVPCNPAADPAACATQFIRQFGRRAHRRPLDDAEVARYQKLFDVGRTGVDFANGVHLVVEAMLQAPAFIYLIEGPGPLTQHQMAARLSYFLWDAPPDAPLSAAADAGKLGTIESIREQARRLLADPRAGKVVADFHTQWLGMERLVKLQKDSALYGDFEGLRPAIIEETSRFVAEVMSSEGGKLESLLAAPYTVVNGQLAALYGVPAGNGDWHKVMLDPGQRAGLLTQAGFLTANGAFDGSSPIPPRPGGARAGAVRGHAGATARRRPERARADAGGHHPAALRPAPRRSQLRQLPRADGQARLRLRVLRRHRPLPHRGARQAGGRLGQIIGTDVDGAVKGGADLARKLARSKQVQACVASQWFRYAFGRLQTDVDKCTVDALVKGFTSADLKVADLLLAIVESDAFRPTRRWSEAMHHLKISRRGFLGAGATGAAAAALSPLFPISERKAERPGLPAGCCWSSIAAAPPSARTGPSAARPTSPSRLS